MSASDFKKVCLVRLGWKNGRFGGEDRAWPIRSRSWSCHCVGTDFMRSLWGEKSHLILECCVYTVTVYYSITWNRSYLLCKRSTWRSMCRTVCKEASNATLLMISAFIRGFYPILRLLALFVAWLFLLSPLLVSQASPDPTTVQNGRSSPVLRFTWRLPLQAPFSDISCVLTREKTKTSGTRKCWAARQGPRRFDSLDAHRQRRGQILGIVQRPQSGLQ